jgi:hypothetical protein
VDHAQEMAGKRRQAAAARLIRCYEGLARCNENLLQHVVGNQTFEHWSRYPSSDHIDKHTGFQYYYHAHNPGDRPGVQENGHFHTFARLDYKARQVQDWFVPAADDIPQGCEPDDASVHLVAISVDAQGLPFEIFTVNQWVTGDRWCTGASLASLAQEFRVDRAGPRPVADWLASFFAFYETEIRDLIVARDEHVRRLIATKGEDYCITRDHSIEVLSAADVTFAADVDAALHGSRRVA